MQYTPARKITNRGSKKNTGFFPSEKNERSVAYESLLESDYIDLLEFDPDVESYQEQPMTIYYKIVKTPYRYTPDFLVNRKSKKQIIEIKPKKVLQKLLEDDKKRYKFIFAQKYFDSIGYEFKIITDEDIRTGLLLENIKYLFAYSRLIIPACEKLKIRNYIINYAPIQINSVLDEISNTQQDKNKYYSYILSMIYSKILNIDLNKPINKNSFIYI